MGFAQSMVGVQWAFSKKRQSAYGTANPAIDIDQTHPFNGTEIFDHAPNTSDNSAMFGKGHEFATRLDILSWNSTMKRTFTATTKILGAMLAFHFGKLTTTNLGGSPSAYQHALSYQDPNGAGYYGSGRQQPVFTVVEQVTSGYFRQFPDMQVKAVELTAKLNDWLMLSVDGQGSGMKTTLTGFSFPDQSVSEGERLRFASCVFSHGVSGSEADISCDVQSFRVRSEYSYFDADGYCPGSGYLTSGDPDSGQVRNKLEFGRRAVVFEYVLRADNTTTVFSRLEGRTLLAATLTFTGATISGSNAHKLLITVPKIRYRAVPISANGDVITYQVQAVLFYDTASGGPFTFTVTNDVSSYLVASA